MSNDHFQQDIKDLETQVEERPPQTVEEAPAPPQKRRLYWAIGILFTLLVGSLQAAILFGVGAPSTAPPPPPDLLAEFENDPCDQRMDAIMDAIEAHTRDHGDPPATLSALGSRYLAFAPVDPESGKPYEYSRNGESVSLSCPNPDLHAPTSIAQQ